MHKFGFVDPGCPINEPLVSITNTGSPDNATCVLRAGSRVVTDLSIPINLLSEDTVDADWRITKLRGLRVAKFANDLKDQLPATRTPKQYIQQTFPELTADEVTLVLGKFGFTKDIQSATIETFDGSRKTALVLCAISLRLPHVLVLDEPTSAMNQHAIGALVTALYEFPGAVVVKSSDDSFVSRFCADSTIA